MGAAHVTGWWWGSRWPGDWLSCFIKPHSRANTKEKIYSLSISVANEAGKCSHSASNRHFTEVTYFNEVKEVIRIICLSFYPVKTLQAAWKMKVTSKASLLQSSHSLPACLSFLSFAYVTPLKAKRGASDFFNSHTDQGPSAITVYLSGHEHMLLKIFFSKALNIPGILYCYHYCDA